MPILTFFFFFRNLFLAQVLHHIHGWPDFPPIPWIFFLLWRYCLVCLCMCVFAHVTFVEASCWLRYLMSLPCFLRQSLSENPELIISVVFTVSIHSACVEQQVHVVAPNFYIDARDPQAQILTYPSSCTLPSDPSGSLVSFKEKFKILMNLNLSFFFCFLCFWFYIQGTNA